MHSNVLILKHFHWCYTYLPRAKTLWLLQLAVSAFPRNRGVRGCFSQPSVSLIFSTSGFPSSSALGQLETVLTHFPITTCSFPSTLRGRVKSSHSTHDPRGLFVPQGWLGAVSSFPLTALTELKLKMNGLPCMSMFSQAETSCRCIKLRQTHIYAHALLTLNFGVGNMNLVI